MSAAASKPSLRDLAAALPEHLVLGADAANSLRSLPQQADVADIVILGMGTGRTAGEVVKAIGASSIPVPILVESAYEIPAFVGEQSLVFAISGSGDTDEVNHAAAASAARGASLVAISTGGWLLDFAGDCGADIIRIPPEIKPPRATFGVVIGALLGCLKAAGFLPEADELIASAGRQLRRRRDEFCRDGSAAQHLASLLVARHVLCQGDTPIGATAAARWKAQINQNARQPASASAQPDASHNEAVAWDCRNDLTIERDAVVLLRHGFEDPRVSQRIDRLGQYLTGKVPVHSLRGEGDTPFAVLMDLMMLGDFTSLHLAELNGVDPSSAKFISHTVKEGLKPPDYPPRPPRS